MGLCGEGKVLEPGSTITASHLRFRAGLLERPFGRILSEGFAYAMTNAFWRIRSAVPYLREVEKRRLGYRIHILCPLVYDGLGKPAHSHSNF